MILTLFVLGFVSLHADQLRIENPQVTVERACRAMNARVGACFAAGEFRRCSASGGRSATTSEETQKPHNLTTEAA